MKNKIKIPENAYIVLNELLNNGYNAGLVGGCVRDYHLNKEPHDWDICTSATPTEVQEIFKHYTTLDIGLKHGTVTILVNNEPIEVTTFRTDGIYSDGRRPDSVTFTTNIVDDLSRRDITINSMYYNPNIGLADPFNGLEDLENRIIRCVGTPEERFQEDALRILRVLRFSSKLGFSIDTKTKEAIHNNVHLLDNVSKERIASEFIQILQGENAIEILREFSDVISFIIPEFKNIIGFKQNNPYHIYDVWEHTLVALNQVKNNSLKCKLAILFHDIGKPQCHSIDDTGIDHFYKHGITSKEIFKSTAKRLKLSTVGIDKNLTSQISDLILYHDTQIVETSKSVKKLLSKLNGNIEAFKDLIDVKRSDILAQNPIYAKDRLQSLENILQILEYIKESENCLTIKDLKINGNDLIQLGIPKGKTIGIILNNILNKVINEELTNTKDTLILAAQQFYEENKKIN